MAEKPFIRVRDKRTKHVYDIARSAFDETKHVLVKRAGDAWSPRRAKHHIDLRAEKPSSEDQGTSPTEPDGSAD